MALPPSNQQKGESESKSNSGKGKRHCHSAVLSKRDFPTLLNVLLMSHWDLSHGSLIGLSVEDPNYNSMKRT